MLVQAKYKCGGKPNATQDKNEGRGREGGGVEAYVLSKAKANFDFLIYLLQDKATIL